MNTKITTMINEIGRICTKCSTFKTWDFYYKAQSRSGYQSCCKLCASKTIEKSRNRKPYTYSDKTLLEMEKIHKSKENRIIWAIQKESKTVEIEKETRSWSMVDLPNPKEEYWKKWKILRVWENPHPVILTKIK